MTVGKLFLIIALIYVWGFVIGEVMYRCKRHRLRKESNLSEYGISKQLNRVLEYSWGLTYVFAFLLIAAFFCFLIWGITFGWNIPLK